MKLHILVEGKSEKVLLDDWLRRFIPQHTFNVIQHRGKGRLSKDPGQVHGRRQGLLDQLPAKLKGFGKAFDPATDRVLVLVDQDEDGCVELKARMADCLVACDPAPVVLFRIATKETEAFYLGDPTAIMKAFPRARLAKLRQYHADSHPESGTWELFSEVIGDPSENKVSWAERMAPHLDAGNPPKRNESLCFQNFCKAILTLVGEFQET